MRGLRKYLTPFAPDQSGAVSVLYEFGGIIVICDAGGCTGNIVDLMSRGGLRAKAHCLVQGFAIWMQFSAVMTGWWQSLQMP